MKTTAFTAGIFSSHLKLNRQLNSNQKSNYKDYQRELYQQRSVQLEGELHEAQTTVSDFIQVYSTSIIWRQKFQRDEAYIFASDPRSWERNWSRHTYLSPKSEPVDEMELK